MREGALAEDRSTHTLTHHFLRSAFIMPFVYDRIVTITARSRDLYLVISSCPTPSSAGAIVLP